MSTGKQYFADQPSRQLKNAEAFREGPQGSRSLWIICPDAVMETALQPVRELENAIIVRHHLTGSYERTNDLRFDVIKFVEDSVRYRGVRDIVICANSLCSDLRDGTTTELSQVNEDPMDLIRRRVRNREKHNHAAKERLLQDLLKIESCRSIADGITRHQLNVHGLFYLAESDMLLLYDKSSECFSPL